MVNAEEMYEANRAAFEAFAGYQLFAWEALSWDEKQRWEALALEYNQTKEDIENE